MDMIYMIYRMGCCSVADDSRGAGVVPVSERPDSFGGHLRGGMNATGRDVPDEGSRVEGFN